MRSLGQERPRFVYFDLDGTLHDMLLAAEAAVKDALAVAQQLLGFEQRLIADYTEILRAEHIEFSRRQTAVQPADAMSFLFRQTLGPDYPELAEDDPLWARLAAAWLESYFLHGQKPFPEVIELLTWLGEKGVGLGIISNGTGYRQRRKLSDLGLDEYFHDPHLLFTDEQGVAKPDPEIFHRALRRSKTEPAETIFVGDSPVNDVPGAMAAGMTVIWLNHEGLKAPEVGGLPGQLHTVQSFAGAAQLVKELVG